MDLTAIVQEPAAVALLTWGSTWGVMKLRTRQASRSAAAAKKESAEAMVKASAAASTASVALRLATQAAEAAKAVPEALRVAQDAARSAKAAHLRIDEIERDHVRRIIVLEEGAKHTEKKLDEGFDRMQTTLDKAFDQVGEQMKAIVERMDALVDRA